MLKWFKKTQTTDKVKTPVAVNKDNTWVVVDQDILKAPAKKDEEVK